MNRDLFRGIFLGGVIGMFLFGTMEYFWGIGGLSPVFFMIGLSIVMVFLNAIDDVKGEQDE